MQASVESIAHQAIEYFDARHGAVDSSSSMLNGLLSWAITTALKQTITSDAKAFELWRDSGVTLTNDEIAIGSDWMSYIINLASIYDCIENEVFTERPDIEEQTHSWRNTLAALYAI